MQFILLSWFIQVEVIRCGGKIGYTVIYKSTRYTKYKIVISKDTIYFFSGSFDLQLRIYVYSTFIKFLVSTYNRLKFQIRRPSCQLSCKFLFRTWSHPRLGRAFERIEETKESRQKFARWVGTLLTDERKRTNI